MHLINIKYLNIPIIKIKTYYADLLQSLLSRAYFILELCLNNPPKPHAYTALPVQQFTPQEYLDTFLFITNFLIQNPHINCVGGLIRELLMVSIGRNDLPLVVVENIGYSIRMITEIANSIGLTEIYPSLVPTSRIMVEMLKRAVGW